MKKWVKFFALAVLGLSLLAPADALAAKQTERIFYTGNDSYIHAVSPDGKNDEAIIQGSCPSLSPDGSKMAYRKYVGEDQWRIMIAGVDGSNPVEVPYFVPDPACPSWHPDGTRILVGKDLINLNDYSVETLPIDGDYYFRISPDGSKVVFAKSSFDPNTGSHKRDLYVSNLDGTGLTKLTNAQWGENFGEPRWSPDGSKIVYVNYVDSYGPTQIRVINADGTGEQIVVQAFDGVKSPVWSPDGSKIAFQGDLVYGDGNYSYRMYTINLDGTDLAPVGDVVNPPNDWGMVR